MEPVKQKGSPLMVAIIDEVVWIKISGRANFTTSIDFKKVVTELWERGYRRFVFELCDCIIMDSTFLGVLAGIGLKFAEANKNGKKCSLELANSSPRISESLENFGVAQLFTVIAAAKPEGEKFEPLSSNGDGASRVEVTRNCLEAHKILMNLNPENVNKFKDVTQFLAEDLKKLEGGEQGQK